MFKKLFGAFIDHPFLASLSRYNSVSVIVRNIKKSKKFTGVICSFGKLQYKVVRNTSPSCSFLHPRLKCGAGFEDKQKFCAI
jgi:hypothetical protein